MAAELPKVDLQPTSSSRLLSLDALREARERELLREIAELRERVDALERQLASADSEQ